MNDPRPTTEELLAAYASGALRGPEAAEVEELLAREPAARVELEAMRSALAAVRSVEPRPEVDPDWDQMARDIRAACGEPHAPGLLGRLRAALRPRHAALGLAVAGVSAVLIVTLLRRQPAPVAVTEPSPDAAVATPDQDDELRVAEVEDLEDDELDALDVALGPETLAVTDPVGDDDDDDIDPAGDPLAMTGPNPDLSPEEIAAWAVGEVAALDGGSLGLGMFEDAGYDDWLATMSEDELDVLEAALADG